MRLFRVMLISVAASAAASVAMAQAPATGTAYVVTYIEVAPSAQGEAARLLKAVAAASRKEAGNERYDVLQRIERQNQFAILEAWTDLKAAEAHASSATLKEFKEKLKPAQVSFYDERPSNGVGLDRQGRGLRHHPRGCHTAQQGRVHRHPQEARRRDPQGASLPAIRGLAAEQPRQPLHGRGNLEGPYGDRRAHSGGEHQGVP
jgi:quinol monooxygenase YgiN